MSTLHLKNYNNIIFKMPNKLIICNTAKIEKVEILPYKGAIRKTKGFRLSITADYDNNFLFHVSVYETNIRALKKLETFSCGTFKPV